MLSGCKFLVPENECFRFNGSRRYNVNKRKRVRGICPLPVFYRFSEGGGEYAPSYFSLFPNRIRRIVAVPFQSARAS